MVQLPPLLQYEWLTANQTLPVLFQPEAMHFPKAKQGVRYLDLQTLLKITLPLRIVGVGLPSDLDVASNTNRAHTEQLHRMVFALCVADPPGEYPVASRTAREVMGLHPPPRFVGMSP